jgi:hypothetical protein
VQYQAFDTFLVLLLDSALCACKGTTCAPSCIEALSDWWLQKAARRPLFSGTVDEGSVQ